MEYNRFIQIKTLLENVKPGDKVIYHEKVSILSEIKEFAYSQEFLSITLKPLRAVTSPVKSSFNYYNYIMKQEALYLKFTLAYAVVENSLIYSTYGGFYINFSAINIQFNQ
jgi:hypothetical protein